MFEHFSFTAATTRRRCLLHAIPMDNTISPSSSRESSPRCQSTYNASRRVAATATSIAEMSHHFDQHSLTPRQLIVDQDESTPKAYQHASLRPSSQSSSIRVCRQRQSMNRLQCTSTHLSRISALVEDIVQSTQPVYDPTHPNSTLEDSTSPSLSPDEQPSSVDSYFGFTPISSSILVTDPRHGSAQHSLRHSHSYKVDKDLRHSASRDGISGGKKLVQKKIRMRRSTKNLSRSCGQRRD